MCISCSIKLFIDRVVHTTIMNVEKMSVAQSISLIPHVFTLLNTHKCITAGNINVVITSLKFPTTLRMSSKKGTKYATSEMHTISTIRNTIYTGFVMKYLPFVHGPQCPSTISFTGSIHSGNPPITVITISRFTGIASHVPSGSDCRMLPCTPCAREREKGGGGTAVLVDEGDEDADDGVEHGHQGNGDSRRADHGFLAVATEVFLDGEIGKRGTYWVRRKRMKPMQ